MSETPNHPEGSDSTLRFDPAAPVPATYDPTASPSDADPTQQTPFVPPGPTYPAHLPAGYQQPGYPPPPGYQQPGYQQPGYQQPGYPPPGYATHDAYGRPLSDKSKVIAGILGIVLGGFGAGRFYTGHIGMGVAQLLVTLGTCGLGHFWGLIDGILILVNGGTDGEGRILRD